MLYFFVISFIEELILAVLLIINIKKKDNLDNIITSNLKSMNDKINGFINYNNNKLSNMMNIIDEKLNIKINQIEEIELSDGENNIKQNINKQNIIITNDNIVFLNNIKIEKDFILICDNSCDFNNYDYIILKKDYNDLQKGTLLKNTKKYDKYSMFKIIINNQDYKDEIKTNLIKIQKKLSSINKNQLTMKDIYMLYYIEYYDDVLSAYQ